MPKEKCDCLCRGASFNCCPVHANSLGIVYSRLRKQFRKRKFRKLGRGSTRETWVDLQKRFVYKIPLSLSGTINNKFEASVYKHQHKAYAGNLCLNGLLAKCKLLKNNILRMEYVDEVICYDLPNRMTALKNNDDGQYGVTKDNKLVMYDYEYLIKIKDKRFTPKAWQ